jgi:hypothetical protein
MQCTENKSYLLYVEILKLAECVNCLNAYSSLDALVCGKRKMLYLVLTIAIHHLIFTSYQLKARSEFMPVCALFVLLMILANQVILFKTSSKPLFWHHNVFNETIDK